LLFDAQKILYFVSKNYFMKKFLRFVVVLLLLIGVGVVILGLVAPTDYSVERTVTIAAPANVVADEMLQYKNFKHWSPWQHLDTNMKTEITGPERTVGTRYFWSGENGAGSGEMIIKSFINSTSEDRKYSTESLGYTMHFKEPWESEADGYWRVEDAGNGQSKAVWGFTTHSGFPLNGIMMLMGMEKMLAKDFDKGLNNLKAVAEKNAKEGSAGNFTVTEARFPGYTYATIRATTSMDDDAMMKLFDESYQALGKAAGNRIVGPASCLVYKWDEQTKTADLAPSFPVSGTEEVKGATMVTVAPSKAYMTVVNGDYKQMEQAHGAINQHIAAKNVAPKLVIEEYIKGPGDDKDPAKWVTNIYYLVD